MKKEYLTAELNVICFNTDDVIVTSGGNDNDLEPDL